MKIKYKVLNMKCSGCENRIKNSLKMLKGVKDVSADHETGEVIVTLKNEKIKDDVKKLLNDLEFTVIDDSELE